MQKRKLQVFVSSTYKDLISERQAAVEAILSAGHIPAGMELFAAGDKSQWQVIKEWIEESDVYLLILGGRYGSVEEESGKSYTQLEYEYALELGKPLFSVVIREEYLERKVREHGTSVLEQTNFPKLLEFKKLVESKMVRFWDDLKDIKLAIHETLNQYSKAEELIGWIPGSQGVNGVELAEELARLGKENATLREKVAQFEEANAKLINGMPIEEFIKLLEGEVIVETELQNTFNRKELKAIRELSEGGRINLFHGIRVLSRKIDGSTPARPSPVHKKLSTFGLIKFKKGSSSLPNLPEFTESGRQLFMYLLINGLILPKFSDDPKIQFL